VCEKFRKRQQRGAERSAENFCDANRPKDRPLHCDYIFAKR